MAKPDTFFFFYHDNNAEQIILDILETAERDSYMWHTMALLKNKQKKQNIGSLIIQTGSRSSQKDIFSGKIKLISDFSPFCSDTSVLNFF